MISLASIVIWSFNLKSGVFFIEMLKKQVEHAIRAITVLPFSRIPTTLPFSDMHSVKLLNLIIVIITLMQIVCL